MCNKCLTGIVVYGWPLSLGQFNSYLLYLSWVVYLISQKQCLNCRVDWKICRVVIMLLSWIFSSEICMIKVCKSQKHFFLKFHCPKNKRNIWQNSALAHTAKYFVRFLGNGVSRKNAFEIYRPLVCCIFDNNVHDQL